MKIKLALLCVMSLAMVACSKPETETKPEPQKYNVWEMKQFKDGKEVSSIQNKQLASDYSLFDVKAARQVFVNNPSGDNFSYLCDFNNDAYIITSMGRQRNSNTIKQDGIKCEFTAKEVVE